MARYARNRIVLPPPPPKPEEWVQAEALEDVSLSRDGANLELSIRKADGKTVGVLLPLVVVEQAFDRLSAQSALAVRATTDETAAKVEYPVAGWAVTPQAERGAVSLTCRNTDGTGFALEMKRDPVTAVPRLELSVDV
jgi:hypothetical protein